MDHRPIVVKFVSEKCTYSYGGISYYESVVLDKEGRKWKCNSYVRYTYLPNGMVESDLSDLYNFVEIKE